MDDGAGGVLSEIDSGSVRGDPTLTSHTVPNTSIPVSSIGKTFMFQLKVFTDGGDATSETIGYTLAGVPTSPSSAPTSDILVTNNTVIKVDVTEVIVTNGSPITSYSIEVDDGNGGDLKALYGTVTDSLSNTYTLTGITEGLTYRFRYRAKNAVGWSGYSPVAYIKAVAKPSAPLAPEFISADNTAISLSLNFATENNGGIITSHELYRDNGDSGATWTQITSYNGSKIFSVTIVNEVAMVAGKIYQFKLRAVNEAGQGEFSGIVSVALARLPAQLSVPTHITSQSTQNRIALSWTANTNWDSPGGDVTGFKVYMAEGSGGVFTLIYSTPSESISAYTISGLTPGQLYRFKVSAKNYNGEGPMSSIASIYACEGVQGISAPSYVSATNTTMVVSWEAPAFDGACPVLSYALFRDDGITGTPTIEVNTANDPNIRNKPTLRQATIDPLLTSDIGTSYTLKLEVTTVMGTYQSENVVIVFATVPPKPTTPPTENSITNANQVSIIYSSSVTGGSPILAYNLVYRVGTFGSFSDLIPSSSGSMATAYTLTSVKVGQTYYFKFRVKNMYGWSVFSNEGTAIASQAPAKANIPQIASYSATTIVLNLDLNIDSKGSDITAYELYWATTATPSTFTQIGTYDGISSTFTLPNGLDTITAGTIYNFKFAARNSRGLGELSGITSIAATSLLSAPTGLTSDSSLNTGSMIVLSWTASTELNTPGDNILGYKLYVFNTSTSEYALIFDGVKNTSPSQTTFSYTSVIEGQDYTFKVSVVTFNGESSKSAAYTIPACSTPSGMAVPNIDSVTLTSIAISWSAPAVSGGCPLTGFAVYLDDGTGYSEVNLANDVAVRNKPELRTFTITALGSATSGSTVKVKVTAFNSVSNVDSPSKSVLLATIPSSPSTVVRRVVAESDETQLTVEFDTLTTLEENGSQIISYSLEIREGTSGNFTIYSGADNISTLMTKFTITSPWVTKGNTYSFRFRAKNAYGWSGYSSIEFLTVAGVPGKPSNLILTSFSSSQIVLDIPTILDDGGSVITALELEYADGLTSSSFSTFAACTLASSSCTIGTSDGLIIGHIYKFRHRVINTYGSSDYSNVLSVGLVNAPVAVTNLKKTISLSTTTQIALTWDLIADSNSPAGVIRGYRVFMVDPSISETEKLVYDGYGLSKTNYAVISGLTEGQQYRFTVTAIDFNGEGARSTELSKYSCIAPSGIPRPQRVSSTSSQIVISWGNVTNTGGCPITGFAVYRDAGDNTDAIIEVNSANDLSVRNNPSLHQLTVTFFPISMEGKSFKFRIKAFNTEDSAYSGTASIVLAGVPQAPSIPPIENTAITNSKQIGITLTALSTITETGGSDILIYEITMQIDGVWTIIQSSTSTTVTVTGNIVEGKTYGFKYRAYNKIGVGLYSAETYITAASVPSRPNTPTLATVDSTQIILNFTPSADDGGLVVTQYELRMETFSTSTVTTVASYITTSLAMTHTLTLVGDSLAVGEIYTFSIRATNAKGASEWSDGLITSLTDPPIQASSPTVDRALSNSSSLYFTWSLLGDTAGEGGKITGYELQIDDAGQGNFVTIYYGVGQPLRAYFLSSGLISGATYNTRVRAYNFNGNGGWSAVVSFEV